MILRLINFSMNSTKMIGFDHQSKRKLNLQNSELNLSIFPSTVENLDLIQNQSHYAPIGESLLVIYKSSKNFPAQVKQPPSQ